MGSHVCQSASPAIAEAVGSVRFYRWTAVSVCCVLLMAGCSNHGSHRSTPTTSRPPPSTSAVTQPVTTSTSIPPVDQSPYTWGRDSSPTVELGGGATADLNALLSPSTTGHWLIAGTRIGADDEPQATVWTSSDGVAWSATALSSPGIPSQAEAAAQFRTETVIVGSVGSGSDRQAAVWLSAAIGAPFVAEQVEPSSGPSYMTSVTAGALGTFAAGVVGDHLGLWSSTTGQQWAESANAEKTIGGEPSGRVTSLLADGGVVYAAGAMRIGSLTEAALWSSGDGIDWHQIQSAQTSFTGANDRAIESLATLDNGLVAVGSVGAGTDWTPASWISPNGVSWSLPSRQFPLAKGPTSAAGVGVVVRSVASIATLSGTTSLIAVGGEPGRQYLWQSTNGLQWTPVPLPPTAASASGWEATLVASFNGTTVVADSDPGQPHVLAYSAGQWHEPSSNPRVFGAVRPSALPLSLTPTPTGLALKVQLDRAPQSIGSVAVSNEVLTSRNGQTWSATAQTVSTTSPPTLPSGATAAVRFGSGWVAVGQTSVATVAFGVVTQARAWTSTNGVKWSSVGVLSAPITASPKLLQVCSTGGPSPRVVAVGYGQSAEGGTVPLAWSSPNGVFWQAAVVQPNSVLGARDEMIGCFASGLGFVAFGSAQADDGGPAPAVWRSISGQTWNRQSVAEFVSDSAYPLDIVAHRSSDWLAIAGASNGSIHLSPSTPSVAGPGSYVAPGPTSQSVLVTDDDGADWDLVDTSEEPWIGVDGSTIAVAAFLGSTPVVAGSVDGELAIWLGAPNPLAPAGVSGADSEG